MTYFQGLTYSFLFYRFHHQGLLAPVDLGFYKSLGIVGLPNILSTHNILHNLFQRCLVDLKASLIAQLVKNLPAMQETRV